MPFDEAARRRDFTVNAISWDPLTGEYLDPFDGRADLARRLLRDGRPATFADDSLRVLRAVQFAARFEFALDAATRAICRTIPLDDLPAERVWGEIEKLLFAPRPSSGLALAMDLGVVARLFPELQALSDCAQEPEWHPEGDVWVHTLQVVDEARTRIDDLARPQQVAVMLGAVCHDLGKPATTAFLDGRIRSMNHEEMGVAPTVSLLDRLNVHSIGGYDVRAQVLGITAHHLKPGIVVQGPRRSRRRRLPPSRAEGRPGASGPRRTLRLRRAPTRAGSTAPRWSGSSNARVAWASNTALRSLSFSAGTSSKSG